MEMFFSGKLASTLFHFTYSSVYEDASEEMMGYSEVEPQNMMLDWKSPEACLVAELSEPACEEPFDEQPASRPQHSVSASAATATARKRCFLVSFFMVFLSFSLVFRAAKHSTANARRFLSLPMQKGVFCGRAALRDEQTSMSEAVQNSALPDRNR